MHVALTTLGLILLNAVTTAKPLCSTAEAAK